MHVRGVIIEGNYRHQEMMAIHGGMGPMHNSTVAKGEVLAQTIFVSSTPIIRHNNYCFLLRCLITSQYDNYDSCFIVAIKFYCRHQ